MSQGQGENSHRGDSKAQLLFIIPLIGIFLSGLAFGGGTTASSLPSAQLLGQVSASQAPLPEDPQLVLVGDNALSAFSPPVAVTSKVLGAIMGQPDDGEASIITYDAEQGDTPASVAERFGISLNTVLWANDLTASSVLKEGKELLILPVSGALHMVRSGDTLSEIATWYKGSSKEISEFNNLDSGKIFAGDIVIIPGGTKPKSLPSGRLVPLANSYFIWPIPAPHVITQGLHPFNAVDMTTGSCGSPVYAAAGGNVQKTGYSSVGGNYVRILHPNGVVTYYGHLSGLAASTDSRVSQGQIIGYIGNTGHTVGATGCHLHFEVRGAANPFAR
ncbi:MAG: peptidoglycan DD-metalloendopeptidase family protein [bacterium]|nr:peptidoglycan DD-metalloendopeptidase family protein [bacterium]